MTENLKPCPFCGGEALLRQIDSRYYVRCENIHCRMSPITTIQGEKERVISDWNTRASNWHIGIPTEEGKYIVHLRGKYYDIEYDEMCSFEWLNDYYDYPDRDDHKAFEVVAWMKHEPCPFCGGEAKIVTFGLEGYKTIGRKNCGVQMPLYATIEETIEARNARPSNWHTGTPEEGWYLVVVQWIDYANNTNNRYKFLEFKDNQWQYNHEFGDVEIIAWYGQKITPYKGRRK